MNDGLPRVGSPADFFAFLWTVLLALFQKLAGLLDHRFGNRHFASLGIDDEPPYRHWPSLVVQLL